MKFFRQKSVDQRKFSFSAVYGISNKTVDSIDEIVKKLRQALSKTSINNSYDCEDQKIDTESDKNPNPVTNKTLGANTTSNEVTNDSHIKQYLENLRQNIILDKIYSDISDRTDEQNINENQNSFETNIKSNPKLFHSFTEDLISSDILLELILKLPQIGFENKKLITSIVCNALLLHREDRHVIVDYVCKKPEILFSLLDIYGYGRSDLTPNSGRILRQCLQHQSLARIVLNCRRFNDLFSYVNQQTFDVAMDAFITFRTLLTTHKELTEEYISQNNELFFDNYMQLIKCENYVTKRQSLEILSLILCQSLVICQLFSQHSAYMTLILSLFYSRYRHIRFRALDIFNVLIRTDSQLSIGVMEFLIVQTNREELLDTLKHFRDCKTKCRYFLDLKPFAAKLILFFDETSNQTE